jgi:hypothetical protein
MKAVSSKGPKKVVVKRIGSTMKPVGHLGGQLESSLTGGLSDVFSR